MPEKIMRVTWDDGAHLSNSRKKPGDYSPLTRNSDQELGQVTLSDVDESDESSPSTVYVFVSNEAEQDDEAGDPLAELVALGLIIALVKATPYVKQWLTDSAVPALKSSRDRIAAIFSPAKRSSDTAISVVVEPQPAESAEVASQVEVPEVAMSAAEWAERFRLMLLAGAFRDEQWQALSTARVQDGGLREVQRAMRSLSPQQVTEGIRGALESDLSQLDPETARAMRRLFTGGLDESKNHLQLEEQPR